PQDSVLPAARDVSPMCLSPLPTCRALPVFAAAAARPFFLPVPNQRRRPPSMSLSEDRPFEESLIQGCLSNNQAAWTELVDGYNERLLAAARHALGASAHNEDDAEQAVAEVWGFLCEHPKCLADWDHRREDLCAFLSKLVRNRARQLRKKRQRRRLVE